MAFEIVFKYYEKTGSCEYDKSKELQFVKTIGDLQNDLPLEKLASAVLGQMARRDILVFDVEIFEFTKKKISFKETKNGIVIKNKKFNLGLDNIVVSEEENVVQQLENKSCCSTEKTTSVSLQANSTNGNGSTSVAQKPSPPPPPPAPVSMIGNRKPIKKVIFSPSDLKYLKGKPWRFTPNKEYFVYKERFADNGIGMLYLMLDDRNREFEVADEFFISYQQNLIGEEEFNSQNNNDLLRWQGSSGSYDVPKLR